MRWVLAVSTDTDSLLEREGGDRKASGVMEGGKSIPWIREDWADFAASQTLCELGSQNSHQTGSWSKPKVSKSSTVQNKKLFIFYLIQFLRVFFT